MGFDHPVTFGERIIMRKVWTLAILLHPVVALGQAPVSDGAPKAATPRDVPGQVRALEGTYTGSWTMYGIDDEGKVVKKMAWTDILKTEGATVESDRAYVTWIDEQTYEGAQGPPRKVQGKEGYFLNREGALGDYFMEMFGRVTRMARLAENVWSCATPAQSREMAMLGFPQGATGQHVQVKVVTTERGVETHHISRLSIVTWTDKGGQEHVLQYISLQGHHQRQP
jgi:hypothetical protein